MIPGSQFLRFAWVGVLVTVLHVIVTVVLVERNQLGPVVANVIAFSIATLAGWALNTRWSFSQTVSMAVLIRYLVVTLLGLLATTAVNAYCAAQGISYKLALLIVLSLVPVMSFSLHRCWTFRLAEKAI